MTNNDELRGLAAQAHEVVVYLQEQYAKAAEPYLKILADIDKHKPPRPIIVSLDSLPDCLRLEEKP